MTQRQPGFNGGIQTGTTAGSLESSTSEQHLRNAAEKITSASAGSHWVPGLSSETLKRLLKIDDDEFEVTGVYPDGGIWLFSHAGTPLVAAEAKSQGVTGNAIERWFKNYCALTAIGVRRFVTVCTGDGFFDGNSAQRTMQLAAVLDRATTGSCGTDDIWNVPKGRLWMYRFKDAAAAGSFDLVSLLQSAVDEATSEQEDLHRGAS
jgi:hypothetical protein